jgi:hypothetical protein
MYFSSVIGLLAVLVISIDFHFCTEEDVCREGRVKLFMRPKAEEMIPARLRFRSK